MLKKGWKPLSRVTKSLILNVAGVLDTPLIQVFLIYLSQFLFSLSFWLTLFRNRVYKLRNNKLTDVYRDLLRESDQNIFFLFFWLHEKNDEIERQNYCFRMEKATLEYIIKKRLLTTWYLYMKYLWVIDIWFPWQNFSVISLFFVEVTGMTFDRNRKWM